MGEEAFNLLHLNVNWYICSESTFSFFFVRISNFPYVFLL